LQTEGENSTETGHRNRTGHEQRNMPKISKTRQVNSAKLRARTRQKQTRETVQTRSKKTCQHISKIMPGKQGKPRAKTSQKQASAAGQDSNKEHHRQ
jgi:hypothetical protein